MGVVVVVGFVVTSGFIVVTATGGFEGGVVDEAFPSADVPSGSSP